ncbi:MAG: hypothetical protein E3J72_15645 [Planctomycetota bacterium]|nr:MAG: hypothetical protein E3J72_15645 [Planctomycetota bacterium]
MGVVKQKELADRIAADEKSVSSEQVNRILRSAFSMIRMELLEGERIHLPEFASIQITEEKARIVTDAETGHRIVRPATKAIKFKPVDGFASSVEKLKLAAILLAVPKNDPFARIIEFHFSRVNWKVTIVESVAGIRKTLDRGGAYLIILDANLKGSDELIEEIKCNKATNSVPLIALYPKGTDANHTDTYRVCADECLVEPFEIYNLLMLAESELARASEEEVFFEHQVSCQVSTKEEHLEHLFKSAENLFGQSRLDEEGRIALMAAFREAIGNATHHGNKLSPEKQVTVNYLLDSNRATVVVTDEGEGFDHQMYITKSATGDPISVARKRHDEDRLGGLGIMLMIRTCDGLAYNDLGNQITLTKKLPPKEE